MYYSGRTDPEAEPRHNRFRDEKRRSKFTEEVAAGVKDGDLYFDMSSAAHQRFFVPIKPGEHGLAEDAEGSLVCVTHIYVEKYGKGWVRYDGGGNLVIKIDKHHTSDLAYAAMQAIEQALYRTPIGRVVGRDALRAQTESLMTAFGITTSWRGDEIPSTFIVNGDAEALAKNALIDLLTFAPENGYDDRLGEIGADADGVGFAKDAEQYALLIDGESDGFGGKVPKSRRGRALPLLSQPVFYAVLGYKGNGRSFQSRITALMEAIGLTEDEVNEARGKGRGLMAMPTSAFLHWVADRLVRVMGESENVDFVLRLRHEAARAATLHENMAGNVETYVLVAIGEVAMDSRSAYMLQPRGKVGKIGSKLWLTQQQFDDLSRQLDAPIDYIND